MRRSTFALDQTRLRNEQGGKKRRGPRQAESRGRSLDLKWVEGAPANSIKSQTNPRALLLQA